MLNKLIRNKTFTYSITSAALVMMFAIVGVKVTGLARQLLYSQTFGDKLDIFYAANLIPETIFNIIALGSINAVLIPVLTKAISKEGNVKASYIFSSILNIGIFLLVVASLIIIFFAPNIVSFTQEVGVIKRFTPDQVQELINMMRLLLVSPVLLGISSVLSAVLHIKRHFLITQLAPLVYNLAGILALFTFVPLMKGSIYGLAYGVILGSLLHLIIQIPSFLNTGIKYHPEAMDYKNKYTKDTGKLMAPRLFSLAGEQIVIIVQTLIALIYPIGSLFTFRNAMLIRDIPISLFGLTLAQAAFPTLSASATEEDITSFKKYFTRTFQQIVFFVLPLTIFIIVMRFPIARLAFATGSETVTWDQTRITALIIFFMSLGIVWMSLTGLLVRAFYSLSSNLTPVLVSVLTVFLEIFLSIVFSNMFSYLPDTNLGHVLTIFQDHSLGELLTTSNINGHGAIVGVALATSIVSFFEFIILTWLLSRKIRLGQRNFIMGLVKKFVSSVLLGIGAYVMMQFGERFLPTSKVVNVMLVLGGAFTVGYSIFIVSEYLLNDEEFGLISKIYSKIKGLILRNKRILNQVYKSFIISQEKKSDG